MVKSVIYVKLIGMEGYSYRKYHSGTYVMQIKG